MWPDSKAGGWSVHGTSAVRGEETFHVGDSILISAPDSQSSQGYWLGHVRSISAPSKITFCFCYGCDFNPPDELEELVKCSGEAMRVNEVVLSDWSHTINVAHVIASACTVPPFPTAPTFLFTTCLLCLHQRRAFNLAARAPSPEPCLAAASTGAAKFTGSCPKR